MLRDYQALVVDEAHRLPEAAQQMATCRLSTQGLAQLAQQLSGLHLTRAAQQVTACARALAGVYAPQQNEANAEHGGLPPVQVPFTVTKDGTLALAALQKDACRNTRYIPRTADAAPTASIAGNGAPVPPLSPGRMTLRSAM